MARAFLLRVSTAAGLSLLPEIAPGAVTDVAENGFTVVHTMAISAEPDKAFAAVTGEIGKWWDPAHTYSRDAANLSIEARPGGCFCERLSAQGGGVRHMTVVNVAPGKFIRFEGGLGPLQAMGVAGEMSWKFDAAEKGTALEVRYVVGGYNPGGFKDLAPRVDGMLKAQLERLKRYVETGKP